MFYQSITNPAPIFRSNTSTFHPWHLIVFSDIFIPCSKTMEVNVDILRSTNPNADLGDQEMED